METTTALVTAFGSYLGIPLSTTQTHVGSTTGVGLAEGRKGAVKWTQLMRMFAGWCVVWHMRCWAHAVLQNSAQSCHHHHQRAAPYCLLTASLHALTHMTGCSP
jgi:hypothetical protein